MIPMSLVKNDSKSSIWDLLFFFFLKKSKLMCAKYRSFDPQTGDRERHKKYIFFGGGGGWGGGGGYLSNTLQYFSFYQIILIN